MKNIYLLADQFDKLVASPQVKVAAGRKNRKQLERDLAYAKKYYSENRAALDQHKRTSEDLMSVIDRKTKEVDSARADIMRAYDALKNMDLHDVQEVRFIGDDVGYVKKKRLFRLDDKNQLVPFKKKKPEDDFDLELDDDVEDADDNDGTDDLLASLVE